MRGISTGKALALAQYSAGSNPGSPGGGASPFDRKFNDAVLDPLLRLLLAYYDLGPAVGSGHVFPNQAPYGTFGPLAQIGLDLIDTGPDGKGAESDNVNDYAAADGFLPATSASEFAISIVARTSDPTPAAAGNIFGLSPFGGAGLSLQLNTDASIRWFADGSSGNFRIISPAGLFQADVNHLIILNRELVGGTTPTWRLFFDNAEVGSSAVSAAIPLNGRTFLLGRNDTDIGNGFIGEYGHAALWGQALDSAQRTALYKGGSIAVLEVE